MQYIGANVPQAWAASSAFMLLQAMLGIAANATSRKLFLDPALPAWLPDVTIRDLTVGDQSFSIRFRREEDATRYDVLEGDASMVERRAFGESFEPVTR